MDIWSIGVSDWRVRLLVCAAGVVTQTRLEEVRSNLGHSVRWRCDWWRGGRLGLSERDLPSMTTRPTHTFASVRGERGYQWSTH